MNLSEIETGIDIAALRRVRRGVPLASLTPFDADPWSTAEDFVRFADNMLRRGWAPPGLLDSYHA